MTQKKEKYLANGNDKAAEKPGQTFDNPAYVDMAGGKSVQINNPTYAENHYVAIETSKGVSQKSKVIIVIVMILLLAAAIAGVVVYFLVVAKPSEPVPDKNTDEDSSPQEVLEGVVKATGKPPGKADVTEKPTIRQAEVTFAGPFLETIPTKFHGLKSTPHRVSPADHHGDDQSATSSFDLRSNRSANVGESLPSTRSPDRQTDVLDGTGITSTSSFSKIFQSVVQQRSTTGRQPESNLQSQASSGPTDDARAPSAQSNPLPSTREIIRPRPATNTVTTVEKEVSLPSAVSDQSTTTVSIPENDVSSPSTVSQLLTERNATSQIETGTSQSQVQQSTTGGGRFIPPTSEHSACGQLHIISPGDHVEITSPNHPNNYDNNLDCTWHILTISGKRILLTYLAFDLEFEYDTLILSDDDHPQLTIYSGEQSPINYVSPTPFLSIRFQSDGSITHSGFRIRVEEYDGPDPVPDTTQCTLSRVLAEGEVWDVVTPNYPSNYDNDLECQWTVSTSTGRIDVYFMDFQVEENYDAVSMNAESANGDLVPIFTHLSGSLPPGNITVPHGKIMLEFSSDGTATERGMWVRFKAEASTELHINATPTAFIGNGCVRHFEIQHGQVIQFESPNYPGLYSSDLDCLWTIHTTDQSHILIRFRSFETEQSYDILTIGTGSGPRPDSENVILSHSGDDIPEDLVVNSVNAWIVFTSDGYQELGGFDGEIEAIEEVPTSAYVTTDQPQCGGNSYISVGESVYFKSPNFPRKYDNSLSCLWVFSTQDDTKLHIGFINFNTEALYDYIQMGEGAGPISGTTVLERHHGNSLPPEYVSTSSQAWLYFASDQSMTEDGFDFTVTAVQDMVQGETSSSVAPDEDDVIQTEPPTCRQTHNLLAGDKVTLTTPNFPSNYDSDLNCLWTFSVPDGVILSVVFDSFNTESGYDYMDAGFGLGPIDGSTIIAQHSGESLPAPITGSPSVWIRFLSDGSIQSTGFEMTISAHQVTTSKAPTPPDLPASSRPGISTTTPVTVHCTREYNLTAGDAVHLTSPNHPSNYPNNLDCQWEFVALDGSQLQVHFISFESEDGHDVLEAGEGFGGNFRTLIVERHSGHRLPDDFISQSNVAWISFRSDASTSARGFAVTVTAVKQEIQTTLPPPQLTTNAPSTTAQGCRRTFHLEEGDSVTVTTPNYPNNYDNMLDCLWVFIAVDQSALEVSFQTFRSETGYDMMEAGEGPNNLDGTTIIHRHSGNLLPDDFVAMSSTAWIIFFSDVSENDSGFEVRVTAIQPQPDVTTRSAKRTTTGQDECITRYNLPSDDVILIESPNYPDSYDNNLICSWIVSTIDGNHLHVSFNTFDTESQYDVLETGEGSDPSIGRSFQFSGSTIPEDFTTLSSSVWFTFRSDRSVNRSGFHLSVTSVPY